MYNCCWSLSWRPGGGPQSCPPLFGCGHHSPHHCCLTTLFFFAIPLCAPPSSQLHHCWSAQPSPSVQPLHFGFTAPVQSGSSTFGLVRSSVYTTYCNWLWILEIWLDMNQGSLALSASAQTAEPQISNYMCAGTYIWLLTCGFCNQHRAGRRQVWRCGVAVVFPCSCSQQVCIETHLTKSF